MDCLCLHEKLSIWVLSWSMSREEEGKNQWSSWTQDTRLFPWVTITPVTTALNNTPVTLIAFIITIERTGLICTRKGRTIHRRRGGGGGGELLSHILVLTLDFDSGWEGGEGRGWKRQKQDMSVVWVYSVSYLFQDRQVTPLSLCRYFISRLFQHSILAQYL